MDRCSVNQAVASNSQPRLESKDPPSFWRLVRGLYRFLHDVYRGESSTMLQKLELNDLPTLGRLGRGVSGFVYETTWKGNKYARKDFPLGSDEDKSVFINEAKYLFNLDHPNIAKCVGYTVGKSSCSLLQEYVDDNLHNTIQKAREVQRQKNSASSSRQVKERENFGVGNEAGSSEVPGSTKTIPFQAPQVVDIISQIAAGMKYLHDNRVVHGDLKPRNVLVCSASDDMKPCNVMKPDKMIVKLADFGLVETKKRIKLVPETTRESEILMWRAPELISKALSEDSHTDISDQVEEVVGTFEEFLKSKLAMADVYSFGLTCAHILRGMLTSPDSSFGPLRQLSESHDDFRLELPSDCPKHLKGLICLCLKSEASSRPTFSYICYALQAGEVTIFRDEIVKTNTIVPQAHRLDDLHIVLNINRKLILILYDDSLHESHISHQAKDVNKSGHKTVVSHSGAQKLFVDYLCGEVKRYHWCPSFGLKDDVDHIYRDFAFNEMKMKEDFHIQGRSRLCKVIRDKIEMRLQNKSDGVCVLGLYGIGGMGKTTICKALCNDFHTKFCGRVSHAELEKTTEEKLLRDVLRRLSSTSQKQLNGLTFRELRTGMKEGKFIKEAVFLAIDNVSDSDASIIQANSYITAKLPPESIVIVTTRSKRLLTILPYIDENECMEMPELEREEARSLFVKSSEGSNKDDEQLIRRCVERCYFPKGVRNISSYYHPLALDVLGRELAQLKDPKAWEAQLDMVDKDIFNQSDDNKHHPVFSILRRSFDMLSLEDQMLFMDAALCLPHGLGGRTNVFEWLGMVHGIPTIYDVMIRLEKLRRKSLLENFDEPDARGRSIHMHDLWRVFCVAESISGELRGRRWVYEPNPYSESSPCESSPPGSCWANVKRMAFLDLKWGSLERVNFARFPNVTVLKIAMAKLEKKLEVDLSGLIHLRSLEICGTALCALIVQGLPRNLVFLSLRPDVSGWIHPESVSQELLVEQIGGLKELQCLQLFGYGGRTLPDMWSMLSLRKANFSYCPKVVTVSGLSTNLRVLDFGGCRELRSCPDVGDLVALEQLDCFSCRKLESLPNLGSLTKLKILIISHCDLITELPGLGDLVALEELHARGCCELSKLPDMRKLEKLRVLNLEHCQSITEVPSLDGLTSLTDVKPSFEAEIDGHNRKLQPTKLQKARIKGCSSEELKELNNLAMFHHLEIARTLSVVTMLQACDF